MAVYGFHWAIPTLFGVYAAGLVMDNIGPYWVWYLAGILSLISAIGFWLIHGPSERRFSKVIEAPKVMEAPRVIDPIKEDLHEP